ncbi:MAG: Zn-dependent alcohol dehydrogenase [SAR202 cluster bacterium]|nr:Zn-dependent alcohol dehydrogenase [SAR202 cluster bacterium]
MKAAVLYDWNTPLVIEDLGISGPGPGEVKAKVMATGVCHSDWHVVKGEWSHMPRPIILGHESAGIVEEVGQGVTKLKVGDHVVLTWKPGCGTCEYCQQGWPQVCETMPNGSQKPTNRKTGATVAQMVGLGGFGTKTVVPVSAAIAIDKDVPFPQAAMLGCSVATGVGAVINTAKVKAGTTVAVFGCGGVGLNVIQGAAIANAAKIIAVDLLDNKLQYANTFGATHTINAREEDPVKKIIDLTGGLGAHYAFEAIGLVPKPYEQSVMCTRRRGTTVWVGAAPLNLSLTLDARALFYERVIMGCYLGSAQPHVDIPRYVSLYKAGKLKLDELISCKFKLSEVNEAFAALGRGEVARGVISYE